MKTNFTKYEKARIIGARALQLSMGAPLLIKKPKNVISVIDLSREEFDSEVLPITVNRPKPPKLVLE